MNKGERKEGRKKLASVQDVNYVFSNPLFTIYLTF